MAEEEIVQPIVEEAKVEAPQGAKSKVIFGEKVGMTQIFDQEGNVVSVTVVLAEPNLITQVKSEETDGYKAIQIGLGKAKNVNKPLKGHLKGGESKHIKEIRVEKPEEYQLGQQILVSNFAPGDYVSVAGISIGKGFAGVIKRHHHHRGPMSHGSKSHRLTGSIGAGTTPGRVLKGRRMSGRMGGERVTTKNLKVVSVDLVKNLILLHGPVPGKPGALVEIRKLESK